MKKIIVFLFSIGFAYFPAIHYVLGKRYLQNQKCTEKEKEEFLLGTLFPDIRYLAGVARSETHCKISTIAEVNTATTFFEAGRRFHCYVDDVLGKCALSMKIEGVPCGFKKLFLRCIEDEIFFQKSGDFTDIETLLSRFDEKELCFGKDIAEKWHYYLKRYFSLSPSKHFLHFSKKPSSPLLKQYFFASSKLLLQWSLLIEKKAKEDMAKQFFSELCQRCTGQAY